MDRPLVRPAPSGGSTPHLGARWHLLALLGVLALALALRLYALDRSPIWWDEGNNAYFAAHPDRLVEMSRLTNDTDPPAHRLALALWIRLFGASAVTLRSLSAACGLLTVAIVYLWGRWLKGPRAGLIAALLLALAPMAIYYSREAKAYPFVTFFALLATYVWARYLVRGGAAADGHLAGDRGRRTSLLAWPAYVLCTFLALSAHYYAVLLVAAQGGWLLWEWLLAHRDPQDRRLWRRDFVRWVLAVLAVVVLLLPWLLLTGRTAWGGAQNVPMERDAWGLWDYARTTISALAAGPKAPALAAILAAGALAAAAVAALLRHTRPGLRLAAAVALLPVLLSFPIQRFVVAFMAPRFLLYCLPALCVLAAIGLLSLRRWAWPVAALLLAGWAWAMPAAYTDLAGPDEDIRDLAATFSAQARQGDLLIVGYIWQEGMLAMYAPDVDIPCHLGWFDADSLDDDMAALAADYQRIWLLTYRTPLQDPGNPPGWWLERHAARLLYQTQGRTGLALYLAPQPAVDDAPVVTFEQGIGLAYRAPAGSITAGTTLPLALAWTTSAPVERPYAVFVQLLDEQGCLAAQADSDPVNGLHPFTQFVPGETIQDPRGLLLPTDLAPGRYRLIVGLYDRDSSQRLRVTSGAGVGADVCEIATIEVTAAP